MGDFTRKICYGAGIDLSCYMIGMNHLQITTSLRSLKAIQCNVASVQHSVEIQLGFHLTSHWLALTFVIRLVYGPIPKLGSL